jgi:tRNA(Ile)-lysidine synthase
MSSCASVHSRETAPAADRFRALPMQTSATLPVSQAIDEALALAIASAGNRVTRAEPVIAVALSGGRDSMVLLDAIVPAARAHGVSLSAFHVNHGLSPNANRWSAFCIAECAKRAVPLDVHRVHVDGTADLGIEAAARAARYRVFEAVDADIVAVAHHAGDQAETLLLQLLRGSGPQGLAAMPRIRTLHSRTALLRPFIALPDTAIDAYAKARGLAWIEDESNTDRSVKRNFLRHEIAPRIAMAFPGYPVTLARAAEHQADAALLLDDLAALDAHGVLVTGEEAGTTLDRRAFALLASRAPHRAKNLLRWFLRQHGLRAPSTARLDAMQRQLAYAAADARVRLAHDGAEIGVHRGRVVVHPPAIPAFVADWHGERSVALSHGTLEFTATAGKGIAAATLAATSVVIRSRGGGERLRIERDRPRQAVKRLLQAAGIPHWQRDALPFIWCGDTLAAVPGIGVDVAFVASPGEPGFDILWHPSSQAR